MFVFCKKVAGFIIIIITECDKRNGACSRICLLFSFLSLIEVEVHEFEVMDNKVEAIHFIILYLLQSVENLSVEIKCSMT